MSVIHDPEPLLRTRYLALHAFELTLLAEQIESSIVHGHLTEENLTDLFEVALKKDTGLLEKKGFPLPSVMSEKQWETAVTFHDRDIRVMYIDSTRRERP